VLMVVKIFAMVWVIRQTDDINVFEEDTTFIFRRPLMMEDGWWSLTLPTVLPMSVVHGSTISPYEQCITETPEVYWHMKSCVIRSVVVQSVVLTSKVEFIV